jgi:L-ascorbate metabolism protein UlaG (beta-lactamase superfamily)
MRIHFVNHASFVVEQGPVRLICDPWIEGTVFNDGWDLLAPSRFRYEDFRGITHIWFSHEHPDHFNPPNIKKIPEDCRREITVLFQHTNDKKVVRHCEKLGFKDVRELRLGDWHEVAPCVQVKCCAANVEWDADSWLCIRTPELTLLNLNDCGIDTPGYAAEVRRQVGRVDVLATQFSYASWQGNPGDKQSRRRRAARVMSTVQCQIQELRPRWVIPFASFVWFCHEENFFMNDEMNRIRDVAGKIAAGSSVTPLVMYPGDSWEVGAAYDSEPAIARYEEDLRGIAEGKQPLVRSKQSVPAEALIAMAESFNRECLKMAAWRLAVFHVTLWNLEKHVLGPKVHALRSAALAVWRVFSGRMEPSYVFVSDHGRSYSFSLTDGLRRADRPREECDAALSSDSLAMCFKLPWGGETLRINGRFEAPPEGREYRFFNTFRFARSLNLGAPVAWKRVAAGIARRTPLVGRLVSRGV